MLAGKPYVPAPYTVPMPRSPSPQAKESPAKGKGKDKGKAATPEPAQEAVSNFFILFSTAVSVTVVLILSIRGGQKLHAANF